MKQHIASHHIIAGATVVVSISAALGGCASPPAAAAAPATTTSGPIAVATARISLTDVVGTIDAGGVVVARQTATIAARILAPVREVRVAPGDTVREGQTLIVLDGNDLAAGAGAAHAAAIAAEQAASAAAAELQAANAGLVLALASHNRIAALQAKRSATAQELDDATAALRSAEARVAGASARAQQAASALDGARAAAVQASTIHSFTTIRAPFEGLITEKLIEQGNMASPGTPLLRLEDTRGFRLDVRVDESRIHDIDTGDRVPVLLGDGFTSVAGTVTEVSRAVEADARAFLVKIALPDEDGVRSGTFGRAQFRGRPRRALTVPDSAIIRRGQLTSVFVVENAVARVRLVSLREREVLAGLTESDEVILSPPPDLTDGRRVSVGSR